CSTFRLLHCSAAHRHRPSFPTRRSSDLIVYTHTPDDNVRAQRILAGEVDGVSLPPKLISSIDRDDIDAIAVQSADWRGVALPARNALTADPTVRPALNLAVAPAASLPDRLGG